MPLIEEPVLVSMSDDNGFKEWYIKSNNEFPFAEEIGFNTTGEFDSDWYGLTHQKQFDDYDLKDVAKAAYAAGQASQQERIAKLEAAQNGFQKVCDFTRVMQAIVYPNNDTEQQKAIIIAKGLVDKHLEFHGSESLKARQIGADDE